MDPDKLVDQMSEAVAKGLAAHEENHRKKSIVATLKKVALQAGGNVVLTSVVLIIGFYFNGVQNRSSRALDAAEKASEAVSRIADDVDRRLGQFNDRLKAQQGLQISNNASIQVLRDQVALQEVRVDGAPVAAPVDGKLVKEALEQIRQKEDKEMYRAQQQLRLSEP